MARSEQAYRAAEDALWRVEGLTPTERWLDLGRTDAHVRVLEVGDGPPVLFVHGASNSASSWSSLAARLSDFRCIQLDRPGCGLSAPLTTRFDDVDAFGAYAESLIVDVLDALELDAAHLVATSYGGYHAMRTAAVHGDRLRRVIELGWTVGAPIERTPLIMRAASSRPLALAMTRLPASRGMARSMLAQVGLREAIEAGRLPDEAILWWQAQLNHTDTMRNEIAAGPPLLSWRGMNDAILLSDDVLTKIDVPVLFLWGKGDLFGGADTARAFAARVPGAQLELVPGGHAVWMDDADGIAARVRSFLLA